MYVIVKLKSRNPCGAKESWVYVSKKAFLANDLPYLCYVDEKMERVVCMAFIDLVRWNPQSNDIFAWKFPQTNLSTATQLVVSESQEAIFFAKGQILSKFGPGKYTLDTENLPLLRNLYGIPFGGNNPFLAEVWFVSKTQMLTIDWKTSPMRFMDPQYNAMIPITATGRYGLKVKDAEKFLVKLVGNMNRFTSRELTDHFMGPLVSKTNSSIISYMTANTIGIMQITACLDQLGAFIGQPMSEFWEDYGMELVGFYITSIDIDTSTTEGRKISEALTDRSAQNIAGYTWQQNRSFDVARDAITHGGDMGMLGAVMLTGVMSRGGIGAGIMSQPGQAGFNVGPATSQPGNISIPSSPVGQGRRQVFCSNCGKKYSINSRFCPFCGSAYHPCPVCAADNPENARRCVVCGVSLVSKANSADMGNTCSRCGTSVTFGTSFCPNCGNKLS